MQTSTYSTKYWQEWRLGVVVWLVGAAAALTYVGTWPEKTDVNDVLMFLSALVGVCAMLDPLLHPWLIRRGLRSA